MEKVTAYQYSKDVRVKERENLRIKAKDYYQVSDIRESEDEWNIFVESLYDCVTSAGILIEERYRKILYRIVQIIQEEDKNDDTYTLYLQLQDIKNILEKEDII